jgi:hypothetical protein
MTLAQPILITLAVVFLAAGLVGWLDDLRGAYATTLDDRAEEGGDVVHDRPGAA